MTAVTILKFNTIFFFIQSTPHFYSELVLPPNVSGPHPRDSDLLIAIKSLGLYWLPRA